MEEEHESFASDHLLLSESKYEQHGETKRRQPTHSRVQRIISVARESSISSRIAIVYSLFATLIILLSLSTGRIPATLKTSEAPKWQSTESISDLLDRVPWDPSIMGDIGIDTTFPRKLYKEDLGKKLLLLDVDTRPWTIEEPSNMSTLSWGRLNHYFYAQMHGYDYRYVQAPWPPSDTYPTWAKLPAIRNTLKEGYKFVVFTDSDVIFPHLKIPLEALLDRWNITSDIALAMAQTPEGKIHEDDITHRRHLNSGFLIAQNIPVAHQMLDDWIECPSDKKYPGCSRWKKTRSHEQNAFGNYVRYSYPNRTRELPCEEANGSPFLKDNTLRKCKGTLVSHYWRMKKKVPLGVRQSFAELVMPTVIEEMMSKWATGT